ncbi:MAG: hypothetical protein H6915_07660 [Novosphingobium sp.]|nr:hypothetical protein [Novosphingobium sp.]MCP5389629.1 hypothetical protein [Novosphingobium sp.]
MSLIACIEGANGLPSSTADRLGQSLGLFSAQKAAYHSEAGHCLAATPGSPGQTPVRSWRPVQTASGAAVLFAGWLDNAAELAGVLGLPTESDNALIYGAAVDRWGDDADGHAIGCYAAIVKGAAPGMRLARSPWAAPPLRYFQSGDVIAAASVTRALQACGLPATPNLRTLADSLFLSLHAHDGWYEGEKIVPPGAVVHLHRDGARIIRWYDHLAPRPLLRLRKPRDYVEAADELLTRAVAASAKGAKQPGVLLSGGLDSTNIAARLMPLLPQGKPLSAFTLTPDPQWRGVAPPGQIADETAHVRSFCAMHPGIEAHFSADGGTEFDHALDRMLLATGAAPLLTRVLGPFHGLYEAARDRGCDLMIAGWHGNATFSSGGEWGLCEYLRAGRLLQLYKALHAIPRRSRPIFREFLRLSLLPHFPPGFQRRWKAFRGVPEIDYPRAAHPLHPAAIDAHDLMRAGEAAGWGNRPHWYSRDTHWRHSNSGAEWAHADILCGFEQLYGIRTRDPTLYRPLVEFCRAVPTDIFLRDGQQRWLARELGRGHLPEEIRTEQRHGLIGADWHSRLARRLPELRAELERAARDPLLAELVDFAELRRRLDDFPAETDGSMRQFLRYTVAVPNLVLAARFLRHASGRNEP